MSQQFGVLNGNSHTSQYMRDLRDEPSPTSIDNFDLAAYTERIAIRYEAALRLLIPGKSYFVGGLAKVREYERQLLALADFANDEAVMR